MIFTYIDFTRIAALINSN